MTDASLIMARLLAEAGAELSKFPRYPVRAGRWPRYATANPWRSVEGLLGITIDSLRRCSAA
jgi:hypothetical protein